MARWEPNTRLKLIDAAVQQFAENGYEGTTVAQIAAQAGVSKMTFFRHFADKREVLFIGQAEQDQLLRETVAAAPAGLSPFALAATAVLELTASFPEERREPTARLTAVVASHPDLRERSAHKQAILAEALRSALIARDVPAPVAGLTADLGVRALHSAFDRWGRPGRPGSLTELAREALEELRHAATQLDLPPS